MNCRYCGSKLIKSKKGNYYCSNICWEKEPYKSQIEQDRNDNEAWMDTMHGDWGCRDE